MKPSEEIIKELTASLHKERFWGEIVRNASVGIAIGYPDGRLGNCNTAYQKITGYTEKELQTVDWNKVLTPPEWEESETAKLQELHRTKKPVQYEKEYIQKNGSRIPVELVVHPKFDSDGNVECYFAFVIDITEQKRAEEELKSSNQQLQASEQQLRAANQQLDASNQQLTANEQQLKAANQQLTANNQQLIATEQQLKAANQQLSASEQKLKATNRQLSERVKELNCLYDISKIVEIPNISLKEIFQKTVELIPSAWQFPKITVCRIILNGKEYKTPEFKKTKWKLCSAIMLDGNHAGDIEVCYLEKKPDIDKGPFLKEERMLLDMIAERLGRITKRQRAEEALRESQEKYQNIFDKSPVSIWEEDWTDIIKSINKLRKEGVKDFRKYFETHPDFVSEALKKVKILNVNNETLRMFDAKNKEIMLASLETVFATSDTLPGFIGELIAIGRGKEIYKAEMALRTVNKELINVLLTMTFPQKDSGSGRVLVSLMDITERKQAEDKLRASEKRFEDIALSSGDWIWEVDASGKYTFASGGVEKILGYTPEELLGKTPFEMMPEEEAERVGKIFQKIAVENEAIIDLENWNLSKKGERVCLLTNGSPCKNHPSI